MEFSDLRNELDSSSVTEACDRITNYIQGVIDRTEDERAFFEIFHELLYRIFGLDNK